MNNLKKTAQEIRMTDAEKSAMRARIFGAPAPVSLASQPSSYFSYSFQIFSTRALVPLSLVLVVLVSSGTAAAAQGTLPGDLLYPVKISINEAVEVALATSPVAKAEVSAKLAERRVEEAEALAAQGKLDAVVGEALAANFEAHVESADEHAEQVEAEDPSAAATLRAKLDSSLLAHGEILATLTVGGAKENQEGTGVVAAKVLARTSGSARVAYAPTSLRAGKVAPAADTMSMTMAMNVASDTATSADAAGAVSLEGDMIDEAPRGDEQAALRTQARAQEAVAGARATFDANKDDLSAAIVTQVSGEFAKIDELMELGSTTLATGHFDEAEGDYTEALRRATKLGVLLKVQARIEQNIISPILEQEVEIDPTLEVNIGL